MVKKQTDQIEWFKIWPRSSKLEVKTVCYNNSIEDHYIKKSRESDKYILKYKVKTTSSKQEYAVFPSSEENFLAHAHYQAQHQTLQWTYKGYINLYFENCIYFLRKKKTFISTFSSLASQKKKVFLLPGLGFSSHSLIPLASCKTGM